MHAGFNCCSSTVKQAFVLKTVEKYMYDITLTLIFHLCDRNTGRILGDGVLVIRE